jgi:hypothetical protein
MGSLLTAAQPGSILHDMDIAAAAGPDQQVDPSPPSLLRRLAKLPNRWRRRTSTVLVCYGLVVIFGVVFGIVRLSAPNTSVSTAVIWGICVAGPLALGLAWERFTGLKAFGFEISLAQAVAQVDATLATALSGSKQQYFSGDVAIFTLIGKVIEDPNIELLELNLRVNPYWWSTRIYLQAALIEDYTSIQRLVFVAGDAERYYIGMVSPSLMRKALAQLAGPDLESVYKSVQQGVGPYDATKVPAIVEGWSAASFMKDGEPFGEEAVKTLVSKELLTQWVTLETDSVEWDKPLDSPSLQALVLERDLRFVPLTQNGRLLRVVNTDLFARQMAAKTLQATLR